MVEMREGGKIVGPAEPEPRRVYWLVQRRDTGSISAGYFSLREAEAYIQKYTTYAPAYRVIRVVEQD